MVVYNTRGDTLANEGWCFARRKGMMLLLNCINDAGRARSLLYPDPPVSYIDNAVNFPLLLSAKT